MSLRRHLEVIRGYGRKPDEFARPLAYTVEHGETGYVREFTLDQNQEWFLTAKVSVTFWANTAQLHDARKMAEKALMARLYGEVMCELPELRLAIANGDRREAFAVLERIERAVNGE